MATRGSGFDRMPTEWYQESRADVDRFLDVERFVGPVLDPACGSGNIPEACRARGHDVMGFDVVDRGWPGVIVQDFLKWFPERPWQGNVICNPPYQYSMAFVLHALNVVTGKVAILEKSTLLEGERRYKGLWLSGKMVRYWQYPDRIAVPPGGVAVPGNHPSTAYAWFVFEADHDGPFSGDWIPPASRAAKRAVRQAQAADYARVNGGLVP